MVSVAGGWFVLMACEMFRAGRSRLSSTGAGHLPANRGQHRQQSRRLVGTHHHGAHHCGDGSTGLAPAHRLERQIQIRNDGEQRSGCGSPILQLLQRSSFVTALRTKTIDDRRRADPALLRHTPVCRTIQPLDDDTQRRNPSAHARTRDHGGLVILYAALQAMRYAPAHRLPRIPPAFRRSRRHLPARQRRPAPRLAMDHPCRRHDRLPSQTRAHHSAHYADCGRVPGAISLPHHHYWIAAPWPGTGRRRHRADAARHPVVHPVQRDRRSHGHSIGPARSREPLPLHRFRTGRR